MQYLKIFKQYYKIVLWVFIIAYLCLAPADEFKKVHITIPYFDKVVHFMMFLILALLISAKRRINYLENRQDLLFILAVLYGGLIELAQFYFTSTRSADWGDWVADTVGVIAGGGVFVIIPIWAQRLLT